MNVYVVLIGLDAHDMFIDAIFSTKEKAEAYVAAKKENRKWAGFDFSVEEFPVDQETPSIEKPCCVCGDPATTSIQSIFGQLFFHVCDLHKAMTSAMGYDEKDGLNRIGLRDEKRQWVELIAGPDIEKLQPTK